MCGHIGFVYVMNIQDLCVRQRERGELFKIEHHCNAASLTCTLAEKNPREPFLGYCPFGQIVKAGLKFIF